MTGSNPAHLSPLIRGVFPATDPPSAIVAAELRAPADASLLLAAELEGMGRAVPKRIQEFTGGRLCARRALAEFGVGDFAVRMGVDRAPIWPEGLAGSITHTDSWCAAVVADRTKFIGLGVDSEIVGRVAAHLWPRICASAELDWLSRLPSAERTRAATLVFAAKEAFYKAQFPSTHERLGFRDVAIEPTDWGDRRGALLLRSLRRMEIEERVSGAFACRYEFHDEFVSAGVALPAVNKPCRPGTP